MAHQQTTTLSVVESDAPRNVTMYNSLGCSLGTWEYVEWLQLMARGDIIVQIGDKFVMGEAR